MIRFKRKKWEWREFYIDGTVWLVREDFVTHFSTLPESTIAHFGLSPEKQMRFEKIQMRTLCKMSDVYATIPLPGDKWKKPKDRWKKLCLSDVIKRKIPLSLNESIEKIKYYYGR